MNNGSNDDKIIAFSVISEKLKNAVSGKDGVRSIAVLCENNGIAFYDSVTASSIDNIWMNYSDVTQTSVYKKAIESSQMVLEPTAFVENRDGKDYYLFHIAKKMIDFKEFNKEIGVVVISLDENVIFKASNQLGEINNEKNSNGINFLFDKDGYIVSFPKKEFLGKNINDFASSVNDSDNDNIKNLLNEALLFTEKPVLINSFLDEKTNWSIINVVDKKYLFNDIYLLQRITVIFGAVAILFSIIFIIYISGSFAKSIGKILAAMKTVQEGELSIQVELEEQDEISIIALRFNKMMNRISLLLEEVKNVTFKQKEAEIRALEAQINPHFLYNTLDSINWMAIEKEEYDISKMLKSLAQILRYSISKSNKVVTIREELEWMKQYIYLQQNRFNYSFECNISVDEEVLSCEIYKLLFQPFIENTLIHGFEGYTSGGVINIIISSYKNKYIIIQVEDNGKGIDEQTLAAICNNRTINVDYQGTGIGIRNVFERLRMYYGEEASWQISSILKEGTWIKLTLPKLD
ncbi:sensor histidine kinase [Paenibacillus sp. LHD-117]|uniref:sensor histidine kinase n=1 Tax=Paenibacillus sp. LHD-117 TaxID=3071412 RepID=UPI0035A8C41D